MLYKSNEPWKVICRYTNTSAVKSSISYIDGEKGILRYRGYPIEELAERSSFLEVSYLLMYGELPSSAKLDTWTEAVMRHSALPADVQKAIDALPHDAHPMGTILTGLCALSTFHPEQNPAVAGQSIYESAEVQDKQIVRLIGKVRRRWKHVSLPSCIFANSTTSKLYWNNSVTKKVYITVCSVCHEQLTATFNSFSSKG